MSLPVPTTMRTCSTMNWIDRVSFIHILSIFFKSRFPLGEAGTIVCILRMRSSSKDDDDDLFNLRNSGKNKSRDKSSLGDRSKLVYFLS